MANRGRWAHIGPKFGALTPSNAVVAWETQATGYERCQDCTRCHLRSAREPSGRPSRFERRPRRPEGRRCGQAVETAFGLS